MGLFDGLNGVYHRHSCVEAEPGEWYITGMADGCFAFGTDGLDIEEIHMPQIVALRNLLNSGAFERMVTAAAAWGRGDTEPPTFGKANKHEIETYADGWQAGRSIVITQVYALLDTLPADEATA